MKKLFAGAALTASLALFASSALADGMGRGGSVKDSGCCCASGYNWGGFYIGAQVGTADLRTHTSFHDPSGTLGDVSFFDQDDGFSVGGQIGYNIQKCMAVFGIEADLAWTDIDRSRSRNIGDNPLVPVDPVFRTEMNLFGTIRTRAGVAVDNLLLFVTGGLAFADLEHSARNGVFSFSDSDTRWGWVVGFGTEYALTDRISWRSDVLYASFNEDDHNTNDGTLNYGFRTFDEVWTLRTAINFKLGGDRRLEDRAPLK